MGGGVSKKKSAPNPFAKGDEASKDELKWRR